MISRQLNVLWHDLDISFVVNLFQTSCDIHKNDSSLKHY